MIQVETPDVLQGSFVDGHPVIDDIGFEATLLIDDHLVHAVLTKLLGDEKGFVVLGGEETDFGGEGWQEGITADFALGDGVPGGEELGVQTLGAHPQQIAQSPEDDALIVVAESGELCLVNNKLAVDKGLVALQQAHPLVALMSVPNPAVAKAWLDVVGADHLGLPKIVELHVNFLLLHQSASIHLLLCCGNKIYWIFVFYSHLFMGSPG